MQHIGPVWKTRAIALFALAAASFPVAAYADEAPVMLAERTPTYDVALTIGPAQSMASMTDTGMGHDMSMGMSHDMSMQPEQVDAGMAVNHWIDVHVTQADSTIAASNLAPTIRIVDKATGEARDLPNVMGMSGGMNASDFHYGQNVFLPNGTYQIMVLLGPSDTAQFRDVMVSTSPMMQPGM